MTEKEDEKDGVEKVGKKKRVKFILEPAHECHHDLVVGHGYIYSSGRLVALPRSVLHLKCGSLDKVTSCTCEYYI